MELNTIQKRNKLNRIFTIGEKGNGGAYNTFCITAEKPFKNKNNDDYGYVTVDADKLPILSVLKFQKGAMDMKNSVEGILNTDILEIVRYNLKCFQQGKLACDYNAKALEHIELALMYLNRRIEDREEREVLGTMSR